MPYHALTHAERETYNARRRLLAHVGDILRTKAVEREKKRLAFEDERGVRSKGLVYFCVANFHVFHFLIYLWFHLFLVFQISQNESLSFGQESCFKHALSNWQFISFYLPQQSTYSSYLLTFYHY